MAEKPLKEPDKQILFAVAGNSECGRPTSPGTQSRSDATSYAQIALGLNSGRGSNVPSR
jgi:hypothetical protein